MRQFRISEFLPDFAEQAGEFRIGLIVALVLSLVLGVTVIPPATAAEKPAGVYRIGYVGGGAPGSARDRVSRDCLCAAPTRKAALLNEVWRQ